ncbi:MAPEG family protein [Maricaulis sp. MIT060901]|uniref:MAPEG family protein n=1 Tax=Maricaulis sp. MIT060901 TaxID=3096993 RepID=UPI00399BFC7C
MTEIQAVGLYAGLNLLLMIFLAANVVRHRRRTSISLGIGSDADLEQAVRAQANCLENAVPGLLALTLLALTGASALVLHGFGVALTFGRLTHAHGLLTQPGRSFGRFYGTLITWLSLLGMAVLLVLTPFIPALQ